MRKQSPGEAELEFALKSAGVTGYERNARFVDDRRWELDFYWRNSAVAVEVQGGLWLRGKVPHQGMGQRRGYEKSNRCVMEGIQVLQFSTEMIRENPFDCVEKIKTLLYNDKNDG